MLRGMVVPKREIYASLFATQADIAEDTRSATPGRRDIELSDPRTARMLFFVIAERRRHRVGLCGWGRGGVHLENVT